MDVSSWLRGLGLGGYVQTFQGNCVDAEALSRLTAEDLMGLGVTSIGHRRKLLAAIAALNEGSAPAAAPETGAMRPVEAERRHLTVLSCDLVESTGRAERCDLENLGEVMRACQAICADVIDRFEGHVAGFWSDGLLAYFGWPMAHEDDAEQAVRAGLQLVEAVGRLRPRAEMRLQARVGVATGQVVIGDPAGRGASGQDAVIGETPKLAARLQTIAAPGGVVIGEATRPLVDGLFELDELGPQRLEGFAEPVAAWRVAGEGGTGGRFEAREIGGLTPLVGREEEVCLLLHRWRQASECEGQVVLLSGEPGIGKSRIARELRARIGDEPHLRLTHQCLPHHQTSPLQPVIEQLERATGFERDDPPAVRLAKLETMLARGTERPDEALPLIAALLGVPTGDRYRLPEMAPQRQKQRTLDVLVDQLEGLGRRQPLLMIFEDAQWIWTSRSSASSGCRFCW
jgi:class 3 adenylate cyclase